LVFHRGHRPVFSMALRFRLRDRHSVVVEASHHMRTIADRRISIQMLVDGDHASGKRAAKPALLQLPISVLDRDRVVLGDDTLCLHDYFGARYLAALQGRWTSPDWSASPIPVPYADLSDPQTLNLYGYLRNNPLGYNDPDGHQQPAMYWGMVIRTPAGQAAMQLFSKYGDKALNAAVVLAAAGLSALESGRSACGGGVGCMAEQQGKLQQLARSRLATLRASSCQKMQARQRRGRNKSKLDWMRSALRKPQIN